MPLNNISIIGDVCTGCGGCYNICPKSAIEMSEDAEGFFYPRVNTNCIDCGLCLRACPVNDKCGNQNGEGAYEQKGYVVLTKNKSNYKRTASGGVFTTVAKAFLSENPNAYVVGAIWDKEKGKVVHLLSNKPSDIPRMSNSKYVQSDMEDIYKKCNILLKDGKRILFSGTPCQVAALKKITGNPSTLITFDIICHGVPSPKLLNKQIKELSDKAGYSYDNVSFRWKNAFWKHSGFYLVLQKTNRLKKIYSNSTVPYFNLFMKNKSHRLSCYKCVFACLKREGDITIGDCDSAKLYPTFYPEFSKSAIIINSAKGEQYWDEYNGLFKQCDLDIEKEAQVNRPLSKPEEMPPERSTIYSSLEELPYGEVLKKYGRKDPFYKSIVYKILDFLPFKYSV